MLDTDFLSGEFLSYNFGNCSIHFANISYVEFNNRFTIAYRNYLELRIASTFSKKHLTKSVSSFENLSIIWSISNVSETLFLLSPMKLGELSYSCINYFLGGL
jgi:hypothetical protein